VVRAMGLGFTKEEAFNLFSDDQQLAIFDLAEIVPESQLRRVCGRIIGERGKAKLHLEKRLGIRILVLRDKVAAIGPPPRIRVFQEVLDRLLHGATHSSAYRHLERRLASLEKI